jgi:hypothetical protein
MAKARATPYSPQQRCAIAQALHVETTSPFIESVDLIAGQFIDSIGHRPRSVSKRQGDLEQIVSRFDQLIEEDGAEHYRQERDKIARASAAWRRLGKMIHGRKDIDREILFFRTVLVWERAGGVLAGNRYAPIELVKFFRVVVAPLLGPRPSHRQTAVDDIVRRYLIAKRRGYLATTQFRAGRPFIADIDRYVILDSTK